MVMLIEGDDTSGARPEFVSQESEEKIFRSPVMQQILKWKLFMANLLEKDNTAAKPKDGRRGF